MVNTMRYEQILPLLVIFLILAYFLAFARGQTFCLNNGNYTNNSTYQTNLHTLLSSLPLNMNDYGFYNASVDQNTNDRVYAMVVCRADIQLDLCRSCIHNTTVSALNTCPTYRQVISWSFFCTLHYSHTPTYAIADYDNMYWEWDQRNLTGNTQQFMSDLQVLLDELIQQAAGDGSLLKVAVGNRRTSNFQTIYALVQCTPDLSQQDCTSCLNRAALYLSTCCDAKGNVRVYVVSCDLRYGTGSTSFYNESRILELESMSMPPTPFPSSITPSPSSITPSPPGGEKASPTRTISIIAGSTFGGLMIVAVIVAAFLIRRRKLSGHQPPETHTIQALPTPHMNPPPATGNANHLQLTFDEIRVATKEFSEELGRGGFGAVFRGKLPGGREIAVKRLAIGSHQGEKEFNTEVGILAQLKHKNLVTLIGFSSEGDEKLLVYEYVQNGSLNNFLFDQTKRSNLDWNTRCKIIGGIVKGIVYLHEDSQLMIVHRDLKPSNVLLDGRMDSKIADFGLARLIELDQTHCSTNRVFGTPGYIAPEYQSRRQFSVKSDMYSFGVLLLEIISGQKNSRHGDLISKAWDAWGTRTAEDLVDPVLKDDSSILGAIFRCIHIGLLCVQPKADDRPPISSIVTMLNSPAMALPEPSSMGFYSQTDTEFYTAES